MSWQVSLPEVAAGRSHADMPEITGFATPLPAAIAGRTSL